MYEDVIFLNVHILYTKTEQRVHRSNYGPQTSKTILTAETGATERENLELDISSCQEPVNLREINALMRPNK